MRKNRTVPFSLIKERVGAYLRRWLGLAGVGVWIICVMGCGAKGVRLEEIRNLEDVADICRMKEKDIKKYLMIVVSEVNNGCEKSQRVREVGKENTFGDGIRVGSEVICRGDENKEIKVEVGVGKKCNIITKWVNWSCGEIRYMITGGGEYKCVCKGGATGCQEVYYVNDWKERVTIGCGPNASCLIVEVGDKFNYYFRKDVAEYVEIIKKIKKNEYVKPDESKGY